MCMGCAYYARDDASPGTSLSPNVTGINTVEPSSFLSPQGLEDRIDTLLRADDFGLPNWTSADGPTTKFEFNFKTTKPSNFLWSSDEPTGFVNFTSAQKNAIRDALDEYSHYINVDFVEKGSGAMTEFSFFRANDLYADTPGSGGGGRGRWSRRPRSGAGSPSPVRPARED